jgi:myxalamid-type polyketide synthase MxaE and MxaD
MGHYAAANLFMDALAYNRSRRGLPALSINWGTWEDMRTFSESERQAVVRSGLEPMRTAGALEILGRVMTERRPQQVVGRIDWTRLKSAYEARRVRPLFADVDVPAARTSAVSSSSELTLRQMALSAPPADRHDLLVRYVERLVNDVMGFDSSRSIDPAQGLFDMGMDSLMSVDLRTRLGASVGQQLPSTLAFNYPSVAALVGYLEREVFATVAATPAADETRGEAVDVTAPSPSDLANLSDADCLELVDAELAAIDSLLKDA